MISIEIFSAPNCNRCGKGKILVAELVAELAADISWRVVDVVEELDYAVDLGVLATPAIAIDGKLVFASLPSKKKLREVLLQRVAGLKN